MTQKSLFSDLEETDATTPIVGAGKAKRAAKSAKITGEDLKLEQFLCFSLYSANHAMNRVYKPVLAELGLTYPQYLAMTILWEKDKQMVGDLCGRLQLESSTITPLLKRLEAMDLLTRQRDTKDERQVRITLTRKGKAMKAKTSAVAACILAATGLPTKDVIALQKNIMKLRDALLRAS